MAGSSQSQQVDGVFGPDQGREFLPEGEFRVKMGVKPWCAVIEKFKIPKNRNIWKNILNVQEFSPPMVADDNVRLKTQTADGAGRAFNLGRAHHAVVKIARGHVPTVKRTAWNTVNDTPHTLHDIGIVLADKNNLIPASAHKVSYNMEILTGKILVYKKIFQISVHPQNGWPTL